MQNQSVQMLIEMGFEEQAVQSAIASTGSNDVEVLITFLENQQNNGTSFQDLAQQPQPQPQQEGQSIGALINQENSAILMSLGFSKNVAEKALLLTGNKGVECAQAWIEEHKNDNDLEEQLMMVQEKKLSPEEIAERVKELTRKAREKRQREEEEYEREKERNRIKMGKATNDMKREMEDIKRRQDAEYAKKERLAYELERKQMMEQLQRDKEARFGKTVKQNYEQTFYQQGAVQPQKQTQEVQEKTYTPIEIFDVGVKQIKVAQPPDLLPDVARNSLSLISKILENIVKNPQEQKFRKISLTSQAYQTKVEQVFGAKNALDGLGFIEEDGFYIYKGQDMVSLQKALVLTNEELRNL